LQPSSRTLIAQNNYKVAHPRMAEKLTIPYKRPIKPVYIRKLVAFIDAMRKQQ
jgi:hypothetical protein